MGKPAEVIVEDMLNVLRRQFYADRPEQRWHWERDLLIKAVTHPAWVLEKRGADLPAAQYQEILQEVIRTIQRHGDTAKVRNFGQYFLKAMQEHMRHHWSRYYEQAKSLRNAATSALALAKLGESPVSALATAHKALITVRTGRPKGKGVQQATQQELF